ncbi:hypothetical protein [Myxococcus qinghaiensis]|uniref:hypothetical protein n=1 Tax=Myxococcus qinghaiensis TaxID=2906758 RepID=UPI0020A79091|nr:hypothetical protein [Myxococcus qinghaiensis]MCP3161523.1 hypothetical protein [Myxococcus qinghaiensis]
MSEAPVPSPRPSIFRKEALAHSQRVVQEQGDLLRISSTWTRWSYVLMALFVVALVLGALLLRLPEGVRGP